MLKKSISLIILTLNLCACATSQKYDMKLTQELGKTSAQIISSWGTPTEIKQLRNGETIMIYTKKTKEVLPLNNFYYDNGFMDEDEMFSSFTYGGNEIPDGNFFGETITDYCQTVFYLKNDIVTAFKYRGNACVAV